MTGYVRKFDKNAALSFRVNNKQLLKSYKKIWEKVEKLMKIDFENKPAYDDEYIKTKIKIYEGSVITNFCNKEVPKEKAPCECLSIIMLDSVIKANIKYYLQTLLEKCKYEQKNPENYIFEDLEISESHNGSNDEMDNDDE